MPMRICALFSEQNVGVPDRTRIGIARGLLGLGVWPRQSMIDHGDFVIEHVAVGLVEIDPLLDDGLAVAVKRHAARKI